VVVVKVVYSCVFNVNMESFGGVQVCSFSLMMSYSHYVVDGA